MAWGRNDFGQLGDGTTSAPRTSPVQVTSLTGVVAIGAGFSHGLALLSDGTLRAWGTNDYGQLGDNTTTNRSTPVAVSGLTGVARVTGGRGLTLALKTDGTLWSWGTNDNKLLGDGSAVAFSKLPVRVGTLTGIVDMSANIYQGLAVDSSGRAWGGGGPCSPRAGRRARSSRRPSRWPRSAA